MIFTATSLFASPFGHRHGSEKVTALKGVQTGDGVMLSWRPVRLGASYRVYFESGDRLLPDSRWIDLHGSQTDYLFTETGSAEQLTFAVAAKRDGFVGGLSTPVTVTMKQAVKKPAIRSDVAK